MARTARVLLVDTDEPMAQSMLLALSSESHVTWTPDAFQALRWLGSGDWYDVILCELELPKMSGLELEAAVSVHHPQLALALSSPPIGYFNPRCSSCSPACPTWCSPSDSTWTHCGS